jgi:cob(I)alamin adenosyltransferase
MKIYTKGGDQGETGLFGGSRVPKDHLRIRAYGTLDELNAVLGMFQTRAQKVGSLRELESWIGRIQAELFQLGAELATPRGKTLQMRLIGQNETRRLEEQIDACETKLAPLKTFILPGGTEEAAFLHLARTVSRRAEREVVQLHRAEPLRQEILEYLNRLSDALFMFARLTNQIQGVSDVPWVAPE